MFYVGSARLVTALALLLQSRRMVPTLHMIQVTPQKLGAYHRKKCTSFFLPDINFITLVLMKNIVFEIFYRGMFHPSEIQAELG